MSLKSRIFISMIFLTLIAFVLIGFVVYYQYQHLARTFHEERLTRKENAINEHLEFVLKTTTYKLTPENIPAIFKDKIHELASIHSMKVEIYNPQGNLLISSKATFNIEYVKPKDLSKNILKLIDLSPDKKFVDLKIEDGERFRTSYREIYGTRKEPLGILTLPYKEDMSIYREDFNQFLWRFGQIYAIMLLLSIVLGYFLSSYISNSLYLIANHIQKTQFGRKKKNEKLNIENASKELMTVIESYNNMVDLLEESAVKLSRSERESAWREMAKQVAHEIKNPLTPMRLTVQMFQMKFNPEDPDVKEKMKNFCETLIQQIDTMSSVASAFSNFASMPAQENETLNLVKIVQLALEIFNQDFIYFHSDEEEIITTFDRTQIIRVVTNLVKNAIQAMPDNKEHPRIDVSVYRLNNQTVILEVKDNGSGASDEIQEKIFEPKFTTKTSGMGLGLAMIKNIVESYNGKIYFENNENEGMTFYVELPIT